MNEINTQKDITEYLFCHSEPDFKCFNLRLLPELDSDTVIGVKTPVLRELSAELFKNKELTDKFLDSLPHKYFEENNLHAFLIERIKDFRELMYRLEEFLPFVNNWATCDQMCPKLLGKHRAELLQKVYEWIESDRVYTVRYAIGILMRFFLDGEYFDKEYLRLAAQVKSDEYYINMMRAWFFATALAKQRDSTIKILESFTLDVWTHNKTIQKACESRRISEQDKKYLRTLKIKAVSKVCK